MGDYLLLALWWFVGGWASWFVFGGAKAHVAWRILAGIGALVILVALFVGWLFSAGWAGGLGKGVPGWAAYLFGVVVAALSSVERVVKGWWRSRREVNKAS